MLVTQKMVLTCGTTRFQSRMRFNDIESLAPYLFDVDERPKVNALVTNAQWHC